MMKPFVRPDEYAEARALIDIFSKHVKAYVVPGADPGTPFAVMNGVLLAASALADAFGDTLQEFQGEGE